MGEGRTVTGGRGGWLRGGGCKGVRGGGWGYWLGALLWFWEIETGFSANIYFKGAGIKNIYIFRRKIGLRTKKQEMILVTFKNAL